MSTTSILRNNLVVPIAPDPSTVSQKGSNSCRQFTNTPCFKYTKMVFIVIYALNIVAWGGMLFLILIGAANRTMTDEYTRKVWIEIDSQILNALFCVTGLGLIPWRLRDLYQAYSPTHRHKLLHHHSYTTKLAWIRVVVWTFFANSLFQIGMAICMWSLDMNNRPGWLVGIFVGLGCVSGAFAGLIQCVFNQKKKRRQEKEEELEKQIDEEQIQNGQIREETSNP